METMASMSPLWIRRIRICSCASLAVMAFLLAPLCCLEKIVEVRRPAPGHLPMLLEVLLQKLTLPLSVHGFLFESKVAGLGIFLEFFGQALTKIWRSANHQDVLFLVQQLEHPFRFRNLRHLFCCELQPMGRWKWKRGQIQAKSTAQAAVGFRDGSLL